VWKDLFKRAIEGGWLRVVLAALVLGRCGSALASAAGEVVVQDSLYGTSFPSPTLGWIVGAFGSIYRTADAGGSWQAQESGTLQPLFDVDFIDEQRGWIVGRLGTILHSNDGGATWRKQDSGVDKHLFAVDFFDANRGVAVGDWGVILTTADGGATWQGRDLGEDVIFNGVAMVDSSVALIAGELGTILRSDDGGATWVKQTSGVDKTLFGLYCADRSRCWAVGIDALLLHSADGGATWQVLNGATEQRALEQVGFGQALDNPSLYSVRVVGDFGVAVGEIGAVFVSEDGGAAWQRLEASKNWALPWFRDLALWPGRGGAIVGAHGHRIMIVDGTIAQPAEE